MSRAEEATAAPPDAGQIAEALGARPSGDGWRAPCPAHNGDGFNLSITEGDGGKVLLHCHSHGCDFGSIVRGIERVTGISMGGASNCDPAELARLRQERHQRQAAEVAERQQRLERADVLRESDTALDNLAAQLAGVLFAGAPGDADVLADQYHGLLDAQREAEVTV